MADTAPPGLGAITPATIDPAADLALVWDTSGGGLGRMTVQELLYVHQGWVTLADAPTIIPNANGGHNIRFKTEITTSRVLNPPVGGVDGQVVTIRIKQGGAGSNAINLTLWTIPSDVNTTPSTAVGTTDFLTAVLCGSNWVILAFTKGAVGI